MRAYIFIDNSAITLEHVCDDGVHLFTAIGTFFTSRHQSSAMGSGDTIGLVDNSH